MDDNERRIITINNINESIKCMNNKIERLNWRNKMIANNTIEKDEMVDKFINHDIEFINIMLESINLGIDVLNKMRGVEY